LGVGGPPREGVLVHVLLPYACFGVIVMKGVVIWAAPVGAWMVGKRVEQVERWVEGRRGSVLFEGE